MNNDKRIFFQSVELISSPSQKKLKIDHFNYKKTKFVEYLVKYITNFRNDYGNKIKKDEEFLNMSKKAIEILNNLSYINLENETIDGYSKMDNDPRVNITISAFNGFPKTPPRIIYFLDLVGLWYLIDMKDEGIFADGEVMNINKSFLVIKNIMDKDDNFTKNIQGFFKEMEKEKFVEIRFIS